MIAICYFAPSIQYWYEALQSAYLSVCLSVCLSARMSQRPHVQISPYFLYMLPMAEDRSSTDDSAMRYVLPVLWMTQCFHIMERMGQNPKRRVCFVQFSGWRHRERSLPSPTACCLYVVLQFSEDHSTRAISSCECFLQRLLRTTLAYRPVLLTDDLFII